MGAPNLRPMAIRIASFDIRRPSEEIGGAFNHAPDSGEPASSNQDLEISSIQRSRRISNMCWITGWSQGFYQFVAEGTGVSSGSTCFHPDKASSLSGYGMDDRCSGRSCCISSEAPSADARKVDGARMEALRNPSPSNFTGRVAWSHESP